MYGELVPSGGGDPIPLLKPELLVGRRESCDIALRFANVSAHHCELRLEHGYWKVRDLGSRNGTKVNGVRVQSKRLYPGDELSIARNRYEVRYTPLWNGAGPPPPDEDDEDILSVSLLERAGLEKTQPRAGAAKGQGQELAAFRYLEERLGDEIEDIEAKVKRRTRPDDPFEE